MKSSFATPDPWRTLSRFTQARVGLGRVGSSLPMDAVLDFSMAHAHARDVIHTPLQTDVLARELDCNGFSTRCVWSCAKDRIEYLHRPDLGRRVAPACIDGLRSQSSPARRLSVIIADGLSSFAAAQHAMPLLRVLAPQLVEWELDDIVLATQARVALGDEIASLRGAEAVVMLIGERPGLNATDSLGAYLTYRPYVGCSDAKRNCISNIRPAGLSYEHAAYKLVYLLNKARFMGGTGIQLKDDSDIGPRKAFAKTGREFARIGRKTNPENCL